MTHRVLIFVILAILGIQSSLQAKEKKAASKNKVNSPTLHIDGEFKEEDQELKFLKDELSNVKGLKRGYKRKAKVYNKLTEESEQLKENFETYIGHRVEYEKAIDGYNKTIECLKGGDAMKCRPDLLKNEKPKKVKRAQSRRQAPPVSYTSYDDLTDDVSLSMSAPMRSRPQAKGFIREIDLRISQRGQELLRCYRNGRYSQQGVLKVQLKIAPNGNLQHLGFEDTSQINDPRVVTCLSQVLYSINYPETPSQKVTTVRKPFVFNWM